MYPGWLTAGQGMRRILYRIFYYLYLFSLKLVQTPRVLAEREPKIIKDELIRTASGSRYAIVVFYPGFGIDEGFIALLRSLRQADVNAIVVCNGTPARALLDQVRAEAQRILLRPNVGRDFGAYRAATLYLNQHALPASRVLYFNDSVIYLAGPQLDRLVGELAESKFPVVGAYENHELHHHLGSYAFSVSGDVFRDPRLQKFWRSYRPYDIRPHAIHQGEMGLSRSLRKAGYSFDVIYPVDRLADRLRQLDPADIISLGRYMSHGWRSMLIERTRNGPIGPSDSLAAEFATVQSAEQRGKTPTLSAIDPGGLRRRSGSGAARAPNELALSLATRGLAKQALIDLMIGDIAGRSQIHAGFGLYHVLMGSPMVKKDLVQRQVYLEQDCSLVLDDVPEATRAAIMRTLINRGRPVHWRGLKLFRLHYGFD
jgi:hypothetical protein